jgi:hypothetical protein
VRQLRQLLYNWQLERRRGPRPESTGKPPADKKKHDRKNRRQKIGRRDRAARRAEPSLPAVGRQFFRRSPYCSNIWLRTARAATSGTRTMPDVISQASRLLCWSISRTPIAPAGAGPAGKRIGWPPSTFANENSNDTADGNADHIRNQCLGAPRCRGSV